MGPRARFKDKIRRLSATFNRSIRKASLNLLDRDNSSVAFDSIKTADFDSANTTTATTTLTATSTTGTTSSQLLSLNTDGPSNDSRSIVKNSSISTPKISSKIGKNKTDKKRADIRLLLCSLTICTIFIILFLPSVLINFVSGALDPRFHMAASNLTWLNSCVNPIVYAMMNTRFRKEYIKLMKSMKNWFICEK